jgi:GntR family transcriptional regulator
MFVNPGARRQLMKDERQRFVDRDWPVILDTIKRLELDLDELVRLAKPSRGEGNVDD